MNHNFKIGDRVMQLPYEVFGQPGIFSGRKGNILDFGTEDTVGSDALLIHYDGDQEDEHYWSMACVLEPIKE